MSTSELSITYHNVVITYDEHRNKWLFTLRGKDRYAESLINARKTIDDPPPKDDKPFRRFSAWHRNYDGIAQVTVTSMTETGRFWITGRAGKERSQAGVYELFTCNEHNDAVLAQLKAKELEIDKLRKESEIIRKSLRNIEPKDWEEV